MASNKTSYLGLSQWISNDLILRSDFNSDNKKIDSALSQVPKIVSGSYTGTGAYGEGSPKKLTFTFIPILVVITRSTNPGDYTTSIMFIKDQMYYGNSGYITWGNDYVSWYSTESADKQMSEDDVVYRYFAIGVK